MNMEIELEEFKNEVYRKIGRNIMLLQKIEILLKYLLSHRNIEGYSKELKMIAENKLEFYQNQNMGQLLKEFFKENTLSNQDKTHKTLENDKDVLVSFKVVFGGKNSKIRKKEQESLDLLRKNRNSLVHNSLPNWDYLNSIEGCELACRELDYQYDDHIKPVFHSLKAYTELLQEGFKEGIKDCIEKLLKQQFLIK